jgi:hypothetical protein
MKIYLIILLGSFSMYSNAQNVGIGTNAPNPAALLHVELGSDFVKGFLVKGANYSSGATVPDLGSGPRMMFYSGKVAFRAGVVTSTQWDNANVGVISTGLGYNTTASGQGSVAIGNDCTASGYNATVIGASSTASGGGSMAIGSANLATNTYSIALGYSTDAGGYSANAFGYNTFATGDYSTSMGYFTTANGQHSTALGNYVSTSGYNGAFAIGDNSTTTVMQSFVDNGFRARFAGGYRLLTNSAANIGVVLLASGNSWSAISDVRMKENFIPVDGESILHKIAAMPLTTWNYKGQDVKTLRHYGPMAQDFYSAFGHDELGEIGCDTLINQQDFLGVNLIAIQALEKRTMQLQEQNDELKKENEELANVIEKMQQQINQIAVVKGKKK